MKRVNVLRVGIGAYTNGRPAKVIRVQPQVVSDKDLIILSQPKKFAYVVTDNLIITRIDKTFHSLYFLSIIFTESHYLFNINILLNLLLELVGTGFNSVEYLNALSLEKTIENLIKSHMNLDEAVSKARN